jgi:hypothetical protein
VEQEQQSRWRTIRPWVLWVAGIVAAVALLISLYGGYHFGWKWTGLTKGSRFTKRTLWDWLQLLIIPAVLAGGGLWFNRQQREQELQSADRRAQDETLQAFLDQMSDLLTPAKDRPSLYDEPPPDSLRTVARARTLTVLSRLDSVHKGRVVQFLSESRLMVKRHPESPPVLDISGADLRQTKMRRQVHLRGADLRGANLRGVNLRTNPLGEISGAYLDGADLRNADLRNAKGGDLSEKVLAHQVFHAGGRYLPKLEGATMPNGQKYEDWLKDKESHGGD